LSNNDLNGTRFGGSPVMPLSAVAFTVLLCTLFGANATAIKISLGGLGLFTTAALRFGGAAVVIFLWAAITGKPIRLSGHQIWPMLILGMVFYVQLTLFYLGLSRTTASHGTLISNILPFVVLVLAHFFLDEDRFSTRKLVGLALGFGGVAMLLGDAGKIDQSALQGDLFVLAAVLVWGCNAVYTKRIIAAFHPIQITLFPLSVAAPLFLVSALVMDQEMIVRVDGPILLSMLYQTLVTASFGLIGWMMMIKKYGATTLHSFIFIMPISGVFFGVMVLDEPLTVNLIGAILLVTVGLVIVNRAPRNGSRRGLFHFIFPGKQ
jgi:drug/metabolite transporter (DMT)-like permease